MKICNYKILLQKNYCLHKQNLCLLLQPCLTLFFNKEDFLNLLAAMAIGGINLWCFCAHNFCGDVLKTKDTFF